MPTHWITNYLAKTLLNKNTILKNNNDPGYFFHLKNTIYCPQNSCTKALIYTCIEDFLCLYLLTVSRLCQMKVQPKLRIKMNLITMNITEAGLGVILLFRCIFFVHALDISEIRGWYGMVG